MGDSPSLGLSVQLSVKANFGNRKIIKLSLVFEVEYLLLSGKSAIYQYKSIHKLFFHGLSKGKFGHIRCGKMAVAFGGTINSEA